MDVGREVREAREAMGLSIRRLAAQSGVSPSTVQRIEAGSMSPTVALASRIFAILGRSLVTTPAVSRPGHALDAHRRSLVDCIYAAGGRNPRVFGSVARGTDRPDSDVDLLVDLPEGFGALELVRLSDQLEELLGVPVDIVDDWGDSAVLDRARAEAVAL